MSRLMKVVVLIVALAAALALTGCGELIESALCRSAASKVCDKWFTCLPGASKLLWGNSSNCYTLMNSWCDDSEAWTGCDVDNDKLSQCDADIGQSKCGSLPASCYDLLNCYKAQ